MPIFRRVTLPEPMTHNLSLVMHERVYAKLKDYADAKYDGNINRAIRMLVYAELIKTGYVSIALMREIGDGKL